MRICTYIASLSSAKRTTAGALEGGRLQHNQHLRAQVVGDTTFQLSVNGVMSAHDESSETHATLTRDGRQPGSVAANGDPSTASYPWAAKSSNGNRAPITPAATTAKRADIALVTNGPRAKERVRFLFCSFAHAEGGAVRRTFKFCSRIEHPPYSSLTQPHNPRESAFESGVSIPGTRAPGASCDSWSTVFYT